MARGRLAAFSTSFGRRIVAVVRWAEGQMRGAPSTGPGRPSQSHAHVLFVKFGTLITTGKYNGKAVVGKDKTPLGDVYVEHVNGTELTEDEYGFGMVVGTDTHSEVTRPLVRVGGSGTGGEVNTVAVPSAFTIEGCVATPSAWLYISAPGLELSPPPPP
jgi:hypothetical protein